MAPRPPFRVDQSTEAAFERQFELIVQGSPLEPVEYTLAAPKWQFLCYLGDRGRVVLHGSNTGDITRFEPRAPTDLGDFGSQRGVYATSDGIWPMFFAVIDRDRYHGIMVNACVTHGDPPRHGYFFSLDPGHARGRPWRSGWVYLLPPHSFVFESVDHEADGPVASTQCVSFVPVSPLARLAVTPQDFPFLHQVRQHDDAALSARAAADPDGFPWLPGDART
jgi:hypothetical protein